MLQHAPPNPHGPVEGDGVSYRGIFWFVVVLTVTTIFCQVLMWVMFGWEERRDAKNATPRSPLAAPAGELPPAPNLLFVGGPENLGEPMNLSKFRTKESETLTTYGWVDRNAGTVRIPIDRAKALVIERQRELLPVRGATTPAPPATPARGR
jgi:hypothetical protein